MLRGIVAFEWRYATRRITFAAAALAFAGFGFVLGATGFGAGDIHVNAPYAVAYATGFLGLVSVFLLTVLVAPTLLRDAEHQMAEIVYSTAVTRGQYLLGRFLGSFLAAATAFLAGMAGLVAGALRHDAERLAAFQPTAYLWAFVVLALPTLLLVAACLFAVAALTRSTLATYVAGVALYVVYFVTAVYSNSPLLAQSAPVSAQEMAVAALVDPFGLSAFFEQTHGWTPAERDTRGVALAGRLLVNRVLGLGASALLLGLALHRFRFRLTQPRRRPPVSELVEMPAASTWRPAHVQAGTSWAALSSAVGLELRAVLRSWPLAALLLLWTMVAGMEVFENLRREEYGTAYLPATFLVLAQLERPLLLFGLLVLVYFSGEIVWRERTVRVAEIVDATPASSALFLASKTLALVVLVAVLVAIGCVVGLAVQVLHGYRPLDLHLYLGAFWFGGAPLVLFAVLAVLLHTLAPNRHAGLLAVLAAAIVLPLGGPGGPEHPLLRYAWGGPLDYSEMNGMAPTARRFSALVAYQAAWAGVFAALAHALWRRGTTPALLARVRALPSRVSRPLAAACVTALLALGAFLYQQVEVMSGYQGGEERRAWRAGYERTWSAYRALPTPDLEHVAAEVDLFPSERRVAARGRYRLRNPGPEPITTWIVQAPGSVRVQALTAEGRPPQRVDAQYRTRVFDVPIPPGGSVELAFEVELDRSAIAADVVHDIVENGTLLSTATLFPNLGYRRAHELRDPEARRRSGLGPQVPPGQTLPERATLDITVSAPSEQTVVGPGVSTETEQGGRRLTRFVTDRPGAPIALVAAARYAAARATAGAVDVEVLHHPAHGRNVPRVLEAAVLSLESFSRRYGGYPWPRLRLAEVPASDGRFAGFALPGVVYLTEDRGFLTDLGDERRIDIVTKRTAHEVAHQWWGHIVSPMDGPGGSAIVETLARDAELTILAERYGEDALRPPLLVELGRYLSGRASEEEVPLVRVDDQAWLFYAKGALVMNALRGRVGSARVDEALRALVRQAQSGDVPTAEDLVEHLRAVTPAEHQAWLHEAWTQSVLYDLRVTSARATKLENGRHRVVASVSGTRDDRPFDGPVEVAVYAEHPDRGAPAPLARALCELRGGVADVELEVDGEPAYVVIDPRLHFIDRNVADNTRGF